MRFVSPETPEQRRQHPGAHPHRPGFWGHIGPGSRPFEFARRVVIGVYAEGTVHAGNLAYLTLLSIFPFFIVGAAFATAIGRPEDLEALRALLTALPPTVASMIDKTATEVLEQRTGWLLWVGALVGTWTVTGFIGTIRHVLQRAYGTEGGRPFWHYRLLSVAIIFAAVSMLIIAFSAQILLTTTEELVTRFIPASENLINAISETRFIPTVATYVGAWLMFWTLTPGRYRGLAFPKWPGALFTTLWWFASVTLLPKVIGQLGGYALTYGGLAGVMFALLFFWLVGYGVVIGAHVNAALVNPARSGLREHPILDELAEARWLDT